MKIYKTYNVLFVDPSKMCYGLAISWILGRIFPGCETIEHVAFPTSSVHLRRNLLQFAILLY